MAYTFHSNFEAGSNAEWDSGTASNPSFPHYSVLAKNSNSLMPYRGAYCMQTVLEDTSDHTLIEGDIDIADAGTSYFRWYMGLSKDFRFTADDTFNVFELQQAGGTVEMSIGMKVTNSTQLIEIGIGDGTAPTSFVQWPGLGKWVCVEILATVSTIGAGVLTLFLDGTQVATLTSLTQAAAVGRGVLGIQDVAATTLGTIYYDQFVQNASRIYPFREQYPSVVEIRKTSHVFVGPGYIDGAALSVISTGDESLILYDTDTATANDATPVANLLGAGQTSVSGPLYFERGCYAVLAGTNPKALIYIMKSNEKPGVKGPMYYSNWGARWYGNHRTSRPGNV